MLVAARDGISVRGRDEEEDVIACDLVAALMIRDPEKYAAKIREYVSNHGTGEREGVGGIE